MSNPVRPNILPKFKDLPPLVKKQVVQAPAPTPVPPPPPVVAPPAAMVQPAETETAEEQVHFQPMELTQSQTYLSIGSQDHGFAEFDLMSHREKGKEVRYLHVQIRGSSMDEKGKESNTFMAITSKDDFEKVKEFFSTLKWED